MRKCAFLLAMAIALAVHGLAAHAQTRVHRLAMLLTTSPALTAPLEQTFFDRLAEFGYHVGYNLAVERRYAQARVERLPALAAELVALEPDVLFAGSGPAALAAVEATERIQVVFVAVADPVAAGIAASLHRPGGNATGLSAAVSDIQPRRLQLLKEVFPWAQRVSVLHDALNVPGKIPLRALQRAGRVLGLALTVVDAWAVDDLSSAFAALKASPPDVLYVLESPLTVNQRARIVEFANAQRLPAVYGFQEFAEAGGLMSYSFSLRDHYHGAAAYVAKILNGQRAAELPVEQPMRFELVLNLRTARTLGIHFPPAVYLRADRVIE